MRLKKLELEKFRHFEKTIVEFGTKITLRPLNHHNT